MALRRFGSLLVHAGLSSSGGFEVESDPEHVVLIQNVVSRCLEKEDICNDFYLQLIKQTTISLMSTAVSIWPIEFLR